MKSLNLILLLSIILPPTISAQTKDWEQEYKDLCSYDKKFCRRIKNSDGTFVRPKKEIVALLKELAPTIQSAAKKLGVDPRAIAGSIMAENSLNVGISDDVQSLLVKIGVANKGEILGKKFSYGLGQLNFAPAREAENYVAKLENRTPMNDQELQEAILTPEKSIYLVGAVIRKVQDDYKAQGIDISDKPEILTTLYNLGKSQDKALETKQSGILPRPNYFGFFVNKYIKELDVFKPETQKKSQPSSSSTLAISKPVQAKEAVAAPTPSAITTTAPKELKLAFNKSMPLYASPPTCNDGQNSGATNLENKYKSMKAFSVTAIAEKEKSFTVLAPTVDCESNAWQLIKLSSGESGWIKKDDLEKSTNKIMITQNKCVQKVDTKCIEKVSEQLKDFAITQKNSKKSEFFAKPFSNSKKVSFAQSDWECTSKDNEISEDNMGFSGANIAIPMGGGGYYPITASVQIKKLPKNTGENLKIMIQEIETKEKDIEKKYNSPLTSPENPYYGIGLANFKSRINLCINKLKFNLGGCAIAEDKLHSLLAGIDFKTDLTLENKRLLNLNLTNLSSGLDVLHTKDTFKQISIGYPGMTGYMGNMPFTDAQYDIKDGDEKKWQMDDINAALELCQNSINSIKASITSSKNLNLIEKQTMAANINMIESQSLAPAAETIKLILAMDEDKKKDVWDNAQPSLIRISKICASLDDLFQLKNDKKIASQEVVNYQCYFSNLTVLENNNELMLKNFLKESILSLEGIGNLSMQFQKNFNSMTLMALGIKPVTNMYGPSAMLKHPTPPASFCPNKTADKIEELVKNNLCIQKVYVPDKWMVSRLNELGDKVIYKPFAEDDRYSFDMEKTQCN